MLVANFLIFFAEVAFVLMASVWAKNNLTALSVALISVVAPLIVYMVVPGSFGEWLSTLIPAGGIGLSNALLYKMISFDFLYAGGPSSGRCTAGIGTDQDHSCSLDWQHGGICERPRWLKRKRYRKSSSMHRKLHRMVHLQKHI